MNKIKLSIIALSVAAITGCSTIQSASQTVGNKIGIKDTTSASATGGAVIGCALGGVVGYATGGGVAQGCAYGGVLVGAVAGITAYEKQLDEAKKVQEELLKENSDLKMSIIEKDYKIEQKDNEVKVANDKAEESKRVLDKTIIEMPKKAPKVKAKTNFKQAFDLTSRVANQSPKKSTIKVYGTKQDIADLKAEVEQSGKIDVKKVNVEYIVSSNKKIECVSNA